MIRHRYGSETFGPGSKTGPWVPDASEYSLPPGIGLLWLKADSITGLADGTPIDSWPNSIGAPAVKGSDPTRPLFRTNRLGGKPVVEFVATSETYLDITNPFAGTETEAELYMVVASRVDPGVSPRFGSWRFASTTTGPGNVSLYPFTDGTVYDDFCSTARQKVSDTVAFLVNTFLLYNIQSSATLVTNYNRVQQTSFANTFTTAASGTASGISRRIGRCGDASFWFDGYIAEILIINRKFTAAERRAFEEYLIDKYKIFATETFETYSSGVIPSDMIGGTYWVGAPDIAENLVRIVATEDFEVYSIGTPDQSNLDKGSGWFGAPDVAVNIV